jgi:lipoprotein-releasing system permease protein
MTSPWAQGAGVVAAAALWAALRTPWGRRALPAQFTFGLAAALTALFSASALALRTAFWTLGLSLEQAGGVMWAAVVACAIAAGAWAAARAQRRVSAELTLAGTSVLLAAAGLAAWGVEPSARPAALRALLVAPAVLALCGYLGASLGHIAWPDGRLQWALGYESLIGRRFLLSRASPVLSVVTSISVVGVSLGVWLVLVSLGILSGFEADLTDKIVGANAHVVLQPTDGLPFAQDPETTAGLAALPEVAAVAPVLEAEVAIASASNYAGAQLFAISPEHSSHTLGVLQQLTGGSLQPLTDECAQRTAQLGPHASPNGQGDVQAAPEGFEPGVASDYAAPSPLGHVVLGQEMARSLNVQVGDRVRIISPALDVLTPLGVAPKSAGLRVAAIFSSKMYEYDARYIFVALPTARRFFELGADAISGYQLACRDPEAAPQVGARALARLQQLLGHDKRSFVTLDWKGRNQTLFAALKLERVVAFVVLVFIILVASFSIVNTLTMSIIEKRREIAILKTMGAHDGSILKVFLVQGLLVGVLGTAVGAVAGTLTLLGLMRFRFWIPGEVYYIDALPVRIDVQDVLLVVGAALVIVWDFAVYPAMKGSTLQPVEGLRDG